MVLRRFNARVALVAATLTTGAMMWDEGRLQGLWGEEKSN